MNADRYRWNSPPRSDSLEHLESVLTQTIAAVRQDSDKRTRIVVNAVISKSTGAMAVGGLAGLIATFGAASTGTAIAALNGAAASTALLYWLGSTIGLGVAAGGVILTATGLGAGLAAALLSRRHLLGSPRSEDRLQEHEKAILVACITLIKAPKEQLEIGQKPQASEMRMVAEHALIPLANQINQHWDTRAIQESGKPECRPFTQTLAYLHRHKLNRCRTEIGRIAMAAILADQST